MTKTYGRGPCRFCGRTISNAGFANHAHKMMHVRQGLMKYRRYYNRYARRTVHEFKFTDAGREAIREQRQQRREAKQ